MELWTILLGATKPGLNFVALNGYEIFLGHTPNEVARTPEALFKQGLPRTGFSPDGIAAISLCWTRLVHMPSLHLPFSFNPGVGCQLLTCQVIAAEDFQPGTSEIASGCVASKFSFGPGQSLGAP
jgi:hypothetical protein